MHSPLSITLYVSLLKIVDTSALWRNRLRHSEDNPYRYFTAKRVFFALCQSTLELVAMVSQITREPQATVYVLARQVIDAATLDFVSLTSCMLLHLLFAHVSSILRWDLSVVSLKVEVLYLT